jgi:hypothetical protein
MRSVYALNNNCEFAWLLFTGKSNVAVGKFETQIKSPESA